ncbi:hypothetical protein ACZ87_02159 [Candidatus Erwinia dacicola]|uniref:Uncharacterized protein n=1 Tax=Candidatus Erwinia dacicola TaxID=252393 RepID=A0A328TTF7_9GAMM|nr:hypothetical protein ACZ87_02159 [Candidatus Erwinia dacicola]
MTSSSVWSNWFPAPVPALHRGVDLSRALLSNWVDACCRLMAPLDEAL